MEPTVLVKMQNVSIQQKEIVFITIFPTIAYSFFNIFSIFLGISVNQIVALKTLTQQRCSPKACYIGRFRYILSTLYQVLSSHYDINQMVSIDIV